MTFKTEQAWKCFQQGDFYYLLKDNGNYIQVHYCPSIGTAEMREVSTGTARYITQHQKDNNIVNVVLGVQDFKLVFMLAIQLIAGFKIEEI